MKIRISDMGALNMYIGARDVASVKATLANLKLTDTEYGPLTALTKGISNKGARTAEKEILELLLQAREKQGIAGVDSDAREAFQHALIHDSRSFIAETLLNTAVNEQDKAHYTNLRLPFGMERIPSAKNLELLAKHGTPFQIHESDWFFLRENPAELARAADYALTHTSMTPRAVLDHIGGRHFGALYEHDPEFAAQLLAEGRQDPNCAYDRPIFFDAPHDVAAKMIELGEDPNQTNEVGDTRLLREIKLFLAGDLKVPPTPLPGADPEVANPSGETPLSLLDGVSYALKQERRVLAAGGFTFDLRGHWGEEIHADPNGDVNHDDARIDLRLNDIEHLDENLPGVADPQNLTPDDITCRLTGHLENMTYLGQPVPITNPAPFQEAYNRHAKALETAQQRIQNCRDGLTAAQVRDHGPER